jgi:hypothetical protein
MKAKYLTLILLALGIYIIVDGLGSIIVYIQQPIIFDHVMRIIRILVGISICGIAIKIKKW